MTKTIARKPIIVKSGANARARHTAPKRVRGIQRGHVEAELGELFRELRAWDELSAELLRAHGF